MDEWEDYGTAEANSSELYHLDRLSELPDSLILEILSLLSIKDVVQTSLLSTRWKNLWSTTPCLDFIEFEQNLNSFRRKKQTPSVISSVLSQWKGPKILKFRLSLCFTVSPSSTVIDSWLLFSIKKQVEEFFLDCLRWRDVNSNGKNSYCLPQTLYSCSSITKLTLASCKLRIEGNVQWNQLKTLEIVNPDWLNGDAMNQILSGAPLLEELVLKSFKIGENFNIRSTSLKMLRIYAVHPWHETSMLRIWAPNLLTINIKACLCCIYLLDVPSLTHAILCFHVGDEATQFEMFNHVLRSIHHVEKLTLLSDFCIEMLVELKNKDMVMPLSNSKILELQYGDAKNMLELVGMMFPKLERLIIHQGLWREGMHATSGEEVHIAMVDACNSLASAKMTFPNPSLLHLKIFDAAWSMCDPSIIPAIQILLENAPILEKMVIRLIGWHASDAETFHFVEEKVLSMPRSSPTAQVIVSLVRHSMLLFWPFK